MNQKSSNYLVANRVEFIKDHSDKSQWHYISSKQNPADYASRGIDVCTNDKVKRWYLGWYHSFFGKERQLEMKAK